MKKVIVIDDEIATREFFEFLLEDRGYTVDLAATGEIGLEKINTIPYDLSVIDLNLPDIDGLELIARIKQIHPNMPIIVVTAYGTMDNIVRALDAGIDHLYVKPFDDKNEILNTIENLTGKKGSKEPDPSKDYSEDIADLGIIGKSKKMVKIFGIISLAAKANSPVIIVGETGTGKELIARAIHNLSGRPGKFLPINCAAIPENLFESTLFGYKKGAFTGANDDRPGLIAEADGGTVLLDEVTEMPLSFQAKFLRVIQEKKFYEIGSTIERSSDFRIISTTNRNIDEAVREGLFRSDLFYRLNVIRIEVPPLRERKEDIPILAEYFIREICSSLCIKKKRLSTEALSKLMIYQYPGNIRELRNIIERAIILESHDTITKDSVQFGDLGKVGIRDKKYREALNIFEREYFIEILNKSDWDFKKASTLAGIHISTLYRKLKSLGILTRD